jgi:ADP-ribose pyrophosphatase YjhB (NUDIX family)
LPSKEPIYVFVRELLEEARLTLTYDDLTMLSDAPDRVALPKGRRQHVYVYSAYVPVPYVTSHLLTPKLEKVVTAQSTINPYGSYVVPKTIDIDGLSLTPTKHGLLSALNASLSYFTLVT